ncbi:hypothetical protein SCLCIDRAFT_1221729, partial [Scleroderma citrinum Foug A]
MKFQTVLGNYRTIAVPTHHRWMLVLSMLYGRRYQHVSVELKYRTYSAELRLV